MVGKHFTIIYAPIVKNHLRAIERKHYSQIRESIEKQLSFEPDVETENRKPLIRPIESGAEWEIRCGPNNRFRVFYSINNDEMEVTIYAIGEKRGNQLLIGGKEVEQ